MGNLFPKNFKNKFGVKVYISLFVLIIFISTAFTSYHCYSQYQNLNKSLVEKGTLITKILSDNVKIGAFSENVELLKTPINQLFTQKEVINVAIYNQEGNLLIHESKIGQEEQTKLNKSGNDKIEDSIRNKCIKTKGSFYNRQTNSYDFWAKIISNTGLYTESLAYQNELIETIGYVYVKLDTKETKKKLKSLITKSILIGLFFIAVGAFLTLIVVRKVIKPLNTLTESVKKLEEGKHAQVRIKTDDEIGELANAFNHMSTTLTKRENELKNSENRLQELSEWLLNSRENERNRMSKELHDDLGQSLALLKHKVRTINSIVCNDKSAQFNECEDTVKFVDEIIENVRRLSRNLSPAVLEDLGLSSALENIIDIFEKQNSTEIQFEIADIDHLFSKIKEINIYRIFQEAFNNINKHSKASAVSFIVKENGKLVSFKLEDNGKGFILDKALGRSSTKMGIGLFTMHERARIINASLNIQSKPGKGTTIALDVPI